MRFFSLILTVTLLCSVSFGQQTTTPATSSPSPALTGANPDAGPATKEFYNLVEKIQTYANQMNSKLKKLYDEYPKASEARKKEIAAEGQKLINDFERFQAPLVGAAKEAFKEAPNKDEVIKEILRRNLGMLINRDDYEKALVECNDLLRLGWSDQQEIYQLAAFAAFFSNSFANAEVAIANSKKLAQIALDRAKKQGKTQAQISKEGIGEVHKGLAELEKDLPYYKAAWAKEKALRQASAQAKDCPIVRLQTTAGDMTIELFANEAPNTVANFIELVNKGFYNGLTFHRVLQSFMAQGGDPNGNGTGGPGYCIPCEVDNPNARIHFRGTLSMAHAGKDTGGSQFFITFRPTKWLDGKHTVFGRVQTGLDVLAKIARNPETGVEPTRIIKAEVVYMPPQLKLPPVKKLPEKKLP